MDENQNQNQIPNQEQKPVRINFFKKYQTAILIVVVVMLSLVAAFLLNYQNFNFFKSEVVTTNTVSDNEVVAPIIQPTPVVAPTTQVTNAQLLTNFDFEMTQALNGWTSCGGEAITNQADYKVNLGPVTDGKGGNVIKLGANKCLEQVIGSSTYKTTIGSKYRFSIWVRSTVEQNPETGFQMQLIHNAGSQDINKNEEVNSLEVTKILGNTWEYYYVDLVVNQPDLDLNKLFTVRIIDSKGEMFMDNLKLELLDGPSLEYHSAADSQILFNTEFLNDWGNGGTNIGPKMDSTKENNIADGWVYNLMADKAYLEPAKIAPYIIKRDILVNDNITKHEEKRVLKIDATNSGQNGNIAQFVNFENIQPGDKFEARAVLRSANPGEVSASVKLQVLHNGLCACNILEVSEQKAQVPFILTKGAYDNGQRIEVVADLEIKNADIGLLNNQGYGNIGVVLTVARGHAVTVEKVELVKLSN